ncbi:hypothetical protein Bpfe_016131 [Biomphalaria pfeifferi]|uniref:Uncharacterized protein n=1 Tax=Biomphalaria pfeifferi TaxID=112525 RepID=A0AAD8F898_BIOPF|nr:hypothetical protein Bpfe_016131 [Biomphalaria pfeifferi]
MDSVFNFNLVTFKIIHKPTWETARALRVETHRSTKPNNTNKEHFCLVSQGDRGRPCLENYLDVTDDRGRPWLRKLPGCHR